MYGTRIAGENWEFEICRVLLLLGFQGGVSNPCLYYHSSRDIRVTVHGDDFVSVAEYASLVWFHEELAKAWTIVVRAILGPPTDKLCTPSARLLNRLVSWTDGGIGGRLILAAPT